MLDDDETVIRVRTPATLAREAARLAALNDETVSQVVRRALRLYVATAPRPADIEEVLAAAKRRARFPAVKKKAPVAASAAPPRSKPVLIKTEKPG